LAPLSFQRVQVDELLEKIVNQVHELGKKVEAQVYY